MSSPAYVSQDPQIALWVGCKAHKRSADRALTTYVPRTEHRRSADTARTIRGEENLINFFSHINSIRSTIQFTIEKKERGQLPFLDVLVRKDTLSQRFHFSVFRKPTHTDSYVNYKSNHHPATKIATILCLRKRAEDIFHREDLK